MLEKQKSLGLFLVAAIDSGENQSITTNQIINEISKGSIFEFISNQIFSPYPFDKNIFNKNEKEHLIGHWQTLLKFNDFSKNFSVKENGLCVLLSLVLLSIQPTTSTI